MKTCGFVIRVSTEEQANNKEGSLTTQLQRLRAHVEYKTTCGEDWREEDRYILRGVSGKDSVRSEEFVRLFADIEAGRINTVICTALDRVSRSVKDFLHFFEFLNGYGVEFVCLKQNYDTTSPQGRFFITVMMALAEFEREQTSERTKDAILARAERGLWNGGQILGYDPDPDAKGNLIPNERERVIVNFAFDTYLECGSILKTAKRMNAQGFRTKEYRSRRERFHPASEFGHPSVQHLLTNLVYVGKKEINKKRRARNQDELPESERYRVVGAVWDPIVDEEKFERVQELMRHNHSSKHNGTKRLRHSYLLNTGLLSCGECSGRMEGCCGTGSKGTKHYYYLCTRCGFRIPAGEIERVLVERIQQLAQSEEILDQIVGATNRRLQEDLPQLTDQQRVLEKDLADTKQAADGLIDQWESLARDEGAVFLKERLDGLGKRRAEIEGALAELNVAVEGIDREAVDRDLIMAALGQFAEVFEGLAPYQRKELIRLVVHKVVVSKESMELGLYGRLPEMRRAVTPTPPRSQTLEWLPG